MGDENLIRVLIVEDHSLLRYALKATLAEFPEVEVVGEAADGPAALQKVKELKPSIILMDIGLPGMNGIAVSRRVKAEFPAIKILMFTSQETDDDIFAALAAGANGYCLKTVVPEQLRTAIKAIEDGAAWIDPAIASRVLTSVGNRTQRNNTGGQTLSSAEQGLLSLLTQGLSEEIILQRLAWTKNDYDASLKTVLEKLRQSKRAENAFTTLDSLPHNGTTSNHCEACGENYDVTVKLCPQDGFSLQEVVQPNLQGTIFEDKYQIEKCIGRGGGGIIYKAHHRYLNRPVAIKVLNPNLITDLELVKRFKREAELASSLRHENLMSVFDFGISNHGQPYFIMEFLEGKNLADEITESSEIAFERALPIFLQICDGLEHAHSKGVVHRDLKPSNILLIKQENSKNPQVKIIDFGIAKDIQPDLEKNACLTRNGEIFGSPPYMSPEQCRGLPVDHRSDIYSMGCLMFETLTGVHPFPPDGTLVTLYRHLNEDPRAFHEILPDTKFPEAVERIVRKALEKEPADRYQTMHELKLDLQQVSVQST